MSNPETSATSYADAGVDTAAGDAAVELMKAHVARTHGPQVIGGVGGFAGLFDASELLRFRRPLLATSTDGVGTKVAIAQALDLHDTVGWDLVGMVVDDIVVTGARPLFMTDYIACGRLVPTRIADLVRGIAAACEHAGCALVGGETAEHPGLMGVDDYDVAGAAVGVVEADEALGADRVRAGDVVLAVASSGLHANGFSLVRRIVADAGFSLHDHVEEFGRTLGEELLEPTRVHSPDVMRALEAAPGGIRALSHVTGGGLAANLARVLPVGLDAGVDRSTWTPPPVFQVFAAAGGVSRHDAERTWNQGVGFFAVVDPAAVDRVAEALAPRGLPASSVWQVGTVQDVADAATGPGVEVTREGKGVRGGQVTMLGDHPA